MKPEELAKFIADQLGDDVADGGVSTQRPGVYVQGELDDCIIDGHANLVLLAEKIMIELSGKGHGSLPSEPTSTIVRNDDLDRVLGVWWSHGDQKSRVWINMNFPSWVIANRPGWLEGPRGG